MKWFAAITELVQFRKVFDIYTQRFLADQDFVKQPSHYQNKKLQQKKINQKNKNKRNNKKRKKLHQKNKNQRNKSQRNKNKNKNQKNNQNLLQNKKNKMNHLERKKRIHLTYYHHLHSILMIINVLSLHQKILLRTLKIYINKLMFKVGHFGLLLIIKQIVKVKKLF